MKCRFYLALIIILINSAYAERSCRKRISEALKKESKNVLPDKKYLALKAANWGNRILGKTAWRDDFNLYHIDGDSYKSIFSSKKQNLTVIVDRTGHLLGHQLKVGGRSQFHCTNLWKK